MSGTPDDPMDDGNPGNADNEPSSQSRGDSSKAPAGESQRDQSSSPQLSTQGGGHIVPLSGGIDSNVAQQKKLHAEEKKRVVTQLKPILQTQYLEFVEHWMKENGNIPQVLLDFVKFMQKAETKPSTGGGIFSGIRTLFSSPTMTLSYVVTGKTSGAHKVIINQLKMKNLNFTELTDQNQHQCERIILFCPITSRAGSDVEAAMRTPAVAATDKQIFLVLLYHTRDVDYSTGGRRCAEKFPRVLSEFHVLFHETQNGLLKCEQNSQAIRELREAICARFDLSSEGCSPASGASCGSSASLEWLK